MIHDYIKCMTKKDGSVLIVVIFAIAILTAFVAGILQLNAEQIQLMKNEVFSAQAMAIAEAGLADAFSRIRSSPVPVNFNSSFGGGSYTVTVTGSPPDTVSSTGTSPQGFVARVEADITVGSTSPYVIRINNLRINE
jgi:Tfp pilus assembly protein PilX